MVRANGVVICTEEGAGHGVEPADREALADAIAEHTAAA